MFHIYISMYTVMPPKKAAFARSIVACDVKPLAEVSSLTTLDMIGGILGSDIRPMSFLSSLAAIDLS